MTVPRAIIVPWYREEDYARLLEISADASSLAKTYGQFVSQSERKLKALDTQGLPIERVYIDPDGLRLWCVGKGIDINTRARQQFAVEIAATKYKNQS